MHTIRQCNLTVVDLRSGRRRRSCWRIRWCGVRRASRRCEPFPPRALIEAATASATIPRKRKRNTPIRFHRNIGWHNCGSAQPPICSISAKRHGESLRIAARCVRCLPNVNRWLSAHECRIVDVLRRKASVLASRRQAPTGSAVGIADECDDVADAIQRSDGALADTVRGAAPVWDFGTERVRPVASPSAQYGSPHTPQRGSGGDDPSADDDAWDYGTVRAPPPPAYEAPSTLESAVKARPGSASWISDAPWAAAGNAQRHDKPICANVRCACHCGFMTRTALRPVLAEHCRSFGCASAVDGTGPTRNHSFGSSH